MNLNWADITIIILCFLNLCIEIGLHGQDNTGKHNAGVALFSVVFSLVLYYCAGMFN